MRNNVKKVLMLIVPLILLVILIVLYRQFKIEERNDVSTPVVTPTIELTLTPTPTPEPTPTAAPTPTPTPTPIVTPVPIANKAGNISGEKVKYQVFSGTSPVNDYQGQEQIIFGDPENYSSLEGITTLRKDNHRSGAAYGTRNVIEKKLEIVWTSDEIRLVDSQWPGVGWTGQPLIVRWPENVRNIMNIYPEFKQKDLVEVIQVTLGGEILFLDLETGKNTRPSIDIEFPIKGSAFVDPRGYPILYTGMGVNSLASGKTTSWKYRIFNLIDQTEIFSIPGKDPNAPRSWSAFDSTGLVDAETDTLFQCGENGLLYKVKLNTNFDIDNAQLSVDPEVTKYRYTNSFNGTYGIELSPVIYRDLMFFADNGGMLQCIDINTLKPKWAFNLGDDTDASPTLEETSEGVFLYVGSQVDLQGAVGNCVVRKINALTGEQVWEKSYKCYKDSIINGGLFSTPTVGTGDISDLVIFNIVKTGTEWGGRLVALDKNTGAEVWAKVLSAYGWSTPTVFKSDDGTSYMIFCDSYGNMYLMDPKTGETLDKISVEKNVEASPAIYNDMVVVGSYARKVFGVRIK
ncbi:MAG TPA: PQQ-binding-like beta-propeller repeat protein [Thermoclostridium sp.]|nr:PQQ-binding-like beta-propeller repeat protein [Thermoclostridium sp.]